MSRLNQPNNPKHTGYSGPDKWERPCKAQKIYPVNQIVAAAKRFEVAGEIENGYQLRLLASRRVIPAKMHRSKCGVIEAIYNKSGA